MLEATADLWTYPADARVVPTNGMRRKDGTLVMGAGVALEAARRYPDLPATLGEWVRVSGNLPVYVAEHGILAWPTKRHWRDPSDLDLILSGASAVINIVNGLPLKTVVLPRVGCGLGGLSWSLIGPALAKVLDDRFVVVTETKR